MTELQIADFAQGTAPLSRTTKDSEKFELLAVNATFDGTGAGAAFLPCVEIISDAGKVVARCFAASVAAGSSAEVTFSPFLRSFSTAGGGGIQFDTSPQTGNWLLVTTTGSNAATSNRGIKLNSGASGLGIYDTTFLVAEFFRNVVDFAVRNGAGTQTGTYIFRYNEFLAELSDGTYTTDISTQHDLIDVGITKGALLVKVAMDIEHGVGWTFPNGTSFTIDGQAMLGYLQETDGAGLMSYRFRLGTGKTLTVQDHLGNAIFRVDENGDLHGLTGKSLTFDL